MLDSDSETLRRVLKADLHLASFDSSCWSAQVSNAFNGLQSSAMFKQKMLRAKQVPMQEFICDLRLRHLKVRREAHFSGFKQESSDVSQVVWEFCEWSWRFSFFYPLLLVQGSF